MEELNNLAYAREAALNGEEVTLRTPSIQQLIEDLEKAGLKITHIKENLGILERIYVSYKKPNLNPAWGL